MSDMTSEPKSSGAFDPETFARNLSRAMESGGQAFSTFLQPLSAAVSKDQPPTEINEVVKTLTKVAEYWMSDQTRAAEMQTKLGKSYLDLLGAAARRLAGEEADLVAAPSPRDKRFQDEE